MSLAVSSLLITRCTVLSCEGGKVLSLLIKRLLMSFLLGRYKAVVDREAEGSKSIVNMGDLSIWPTVGQILLLVKSGYLF